MIQKVKDWKENKGKQYRILERDRHYNFITTVVRNIDDKKFERGDYVFAFDDNWRGNHIQISAFIDSFYLDCISVRIHVLSIKNFTHKTSVSKIVEMKDFSDNLFFINLFEEAVAALEQKYPSTTHNYSD